MAKKDGGASKLAAQERQDELDRQNRIRAGTTSINSTFDNQFNDDFYGKRQQSYLDYATPQLQDQYADAKKQLVYSLARGGNLDSSARAELEGKLQKTYDTNLQGVQDQALSYKTQAQNDVESARASLISALNSTGDADAAASQAQAKASALSTAPAYSTLSNLFSNFTGLLDTAAAANKANYYSNGGTYTGGGANLYSNSSGSVKVK